MHHPASDNNSWLSDLPPLVQGQTNRFGPDANPFRMVSRLCEETGELAQAVNHAEDMGIKNAKNGPLEPDAMAKEVLDVLRAALTIATHYNLIPTLASQSKNTLADYLRNGWLE